VWELHNYLMIDLYFSFLAIVVSMYCTYLCNRFSIVFYFILCLFRYAMPVKLCMFV